MSDRRRDEAGQATVLVLGFAAVLASGLALVVDATAAYLQRQSLHTLADGAALYGADVGATGHDVYAGGIPDRRLELTTARARAGVEDYLRQVSAHQRFPGLQADVAVDPVDGRVTVSLSAPLDLPLDLPGAPDRTVVGGAGAAVVETDPID